MGILLGDPSKPARGDDIRQGSERRVVSFVLIAGLAVPLLIAIAVAATACGVGGAVGDAGTVSTTEGAQTGQFFPHAE